MMKKNVLLEQAHEILRGLIQKNDIMVDATMGNGHDTLLLSSLAKEVYAFDIQEQALVKTKEKVGTLPHVHLILDSFEHIHDYVKNYRGVIFNLGYLPQGDTSITTMHDVTIRTLTMISSHLVKDGFIQIVVYPGHPEGKVESDAIQQWLKTLNPHHFQITETSFYHQDNDPPYMMMIYKTKDEG
jgi:hypothetical protein